WAYLPTGSDTQLLMEFDLAENWTIADGAGVHVINVACHEFGHLMGLSHSTLQSALMAPYYNVAILTPQTQDDIPRFVARYGGKPTEVAPVTPSVPPAPAAPTTVQTSIAITGTCGSV